MQREQSAGVEASVSGRRTVGAAIMLAAALTLIALAAHA